MPPQLLLFGGFLEFYSFDLSRQVLLVISITMLLFFMGIAVWMCIRKHTLVVACVCKLTWNESYENR